MNFSERNGLVEINKKLQINSISLELSVRLWNAFLIFLSKLSSGEKDDKLRDIWKEKMVRPLDSMPRDLLYNRINTNELQQRVKDWYNTLPWNQVYDFYEFIIGTTFEPREFIEGLNVALIKEGAGYRVSNEIFVPITSEIEIQEIGEATKGEIDGPVQIHLKSALEKLTDREKPDYRNSVKESISAVEALCREITDKPKEGLRTALAILEKKHDLHPTLKEGFIKLYSYTSDSGGIRHALDKDGVEVTFDDAKYMLVSCSAFINYLRSKTLSI